MRKIKLIVEKNEDGYWGQIDELPEVFSRGDSISHLLDNANEAISLYWEEMRQKPYAYEFELVMDIQQFFKANEYINITSLARRIGINASLLRQYAKGIKFPSTEQVAKIEDAVQQIGRELMSTELQPV